VCDTGVCIAEAFSLEALKVDWDGLSLEVMGKGRRPRRGPFSNELRRTLTARLSGDWMRLHVGQALQVRPAYVPCPHAVPVTLKYRD
jgi:hypothetical protein